MTEGTKSYLFGCHHWLFHPLGVILAWRCHYGRWPRFWKIVCIFLHDIGIVGTNYLRDGKKNHWRRGAEWSMKLFGEDAFWFVATHDPTCEYIEERGRSEMFIPDKLCWLYQPRILLEIYQRVEGFYKHCTVEEWLTKVKANRDKGFPEGGHAIYMKMRSEATQ